MADLSITRTGTADKGLQPTPTLLRIFRFVLIRSLTLLFGGEQPLAGDYELKAYAYVFEEEADVDLEVILQG